MANYKKYDPRLESLVMETRTLWADDVQDLSEDDKRLLAQSLHDHPQLASQILYERSHTGFTREITITQADIQSVYDHKFAE